MDNIALTEAKVKGNLDIPLDFLSEFLYMLSQFLRLKAPSIHGFSQPPIDAIMTGVRPYGSDLRI